MGPKGTRAEPKRFGAWTASAAIVAAGMLIAQPAQAQFFGDTMSSSEVAYVLSDSGYRMVGQPQRSGRYYVAEGVGSDGRRMRVLVDAYAGVVVGAKPVQQQEAQARGLSSLFAPEPRLVPPRNVPNVQQPAFRPFSQQPADRPSSQQSAGHATGVQQSTAGQPSFEQPAGQSLFQQPGGQQFGGQQPGGQSLFQDPARAPAQERREANVRRDGEGVRPAVRTVPEQRAPQQKALRKPVREKPAEHPAADRPTGTAALHDSRQAPGRAATQSRSPEKPTASINGGEKKGDSAGMVAPVLLDDVKPNRAKEPPPMPQVAPLE
jgi:hypothetical protein